MVKSNNNILDLADKFDIFFFDAFGVLWNGTSFFDGALASLKKLIDMGKTVFILSNSTKVSDDARKSYLKHGLIKNIHYNEIITSGEYLRFVLLNKKLSFKQNKDPKNYYCFGKNNKKLFEGTKYNIVNNLDEADFIYLSSLSLTKEDFEKAPDNLKKYFVRLKESKDESYRATNLELLLPKIDEIIVKSGLPVLSGNPDLTALVGVLESDEPVSIITSGSVAEYLQNRNVEVVEVGKPHIEIFEFALSKLEKYVVKVNKEKICMVGDTLRTDIKGANNIGIKSVLCVATGITAEALKNGCKLNNLVVQSNTSVDYTIKGVGFLLINNFKEKYDGKENDNKKHFLGC